MSLLPFMPSLFICAPVRDFVPGPCRDAIFDFGIDYTKKGGLVWIKSTWLSSNLSNVRTMLMQEALKSQAGYILSLDADIFPTVQNFYDLIKYGEKYPIVAGSYVHRNPFNQSVIGEPLQNGIVENGYTEMKWIGLGFTLIRRWELQLLMTTYKEELFRMTSSQSDDQSFSKCYRDSGGKLFMRPDLRVGHIGLHLFR